LREAQKNRCVLKKFNFLEKKNIYFNFFFIQMMQKWNKNGLTKHKIKISDIQNLCHNILDPILKNLD